MIKIYPEPAQDDAFWSLMGRYFADRRYAKEMGGWQFYTEPNSVWFLLFDDGALAGFCAAFFRKTHIFWDNFYIFPPYRGQGLSRQLIDARLAYCQTTTKPIKAITDNPRQVRNYERINMQTQGQRGRYTRFILHHTGHDSDAGVGAIGLSSAQPMEPE